MQAAHRVKYYFTRCAFAKYYFTKKNASRRTPAGAGDTLEITLHRRPDSDKVESF
jgi:hypothetical protein